MAKKAGTSRTAKRSASKSGRKAASKGPKTAATPSNVTRRGRLAALKIPPPEAIKIDPPDRPKPKAAKREFSLTIREGAPPEAQTVIYVHGIGNKPVASVLKCQWDRALFGTDLGDRSRMAYWVSRDTYPRAEDATCEDSDQVSVDDDEMTTRNVLALARGVSTEQVDPVEQEIDALASENRDRGVTPELFARGGTGCGGSPRK